MPLSQEQADAISAIIGSTTPFVAPINPLIPVGIGIVQSLIKAEPALEGALKALFSGKDPLTTADFDAAIAHVEASSYRKLVPESSLTELEDPSMPKPEAITAPPAP